jgi:RNA polymerase sigma-70 factor, ECF subfamily
MTKDREEFDAMSAEPSVLPATGYAMPDEEVVQRVRAGEVDLFEIIMRRYNQRLYRASRAILGDDSEAEDVMQDAYVRAYTHLDQFEERSKFSTWLIRIAVHEALARARRRSRLVEIDPILDSDEESMKILGASSQDPEQLVMASELRAALETAIDALPETYRSVFVLREVEELSTKETAECLDLSEETVKVRLHRARALVYQRLLDRPGAAAKEAFQFHLSRCDRVVAGVFERIKRLER